MDLFFTVEKRYKHHIDGFYYVLNVLMKWREYFIWFPIALIISWGCWIIPIWIVSIYQDAKKYRDKESEYRKWLLDSAKDKEELEKMIEKLEEEKEWANDIINDYIGYTWIFPREISEKLEKRNKRKKRD